MVLAEGHRVQRVQGTALEGSGSCKPFWSHAQKPSSVSAISWALPISYNRDHSPQEISFFFLQPV